MPKRFHDWSFCDQLYTACSDAGEEIRFTRQERAVLAELMARPHSPVTRDRLLEVLPRQDGKHLEGSVRQVDHVVSQLRQRLGDTSHKPRFIATYYGNGYRWIAEPGAPALAMDAVLVIQPLHRKTFAAADALIGAWCDALAERIRLPGGTPKGVAIAPAPPWQPAAGNRHVFLLEISTWADAATLHAALLLRDARTRQPLQPLRVTLALARAQDPLAVQNEARSLVDALLPRIWAYHALASGEAPADIPLEVRMHEATLLFGQSHTTWNESLAYVERLDRQVWQAPVRDIARAMALLVRLILQSPRTQCLSPQEWDAHDAEIERLVLPHLPAIAGQPLLELAAARLLHAIGGRHGDTALQLAQSGFADTTAFATAFPTLAQCLVWKGDFDTAHALYERGLDFAEPASEYHLYLLTLRCIACLGSGDREGLARCRTELFAVKPATRQEMGLLLHCLDADLPVDVAAVLPQLPEAVLRPMVYLIQRKACNLFAQPEHQAHLLRGLASHLARHVGPHILPGELRALVEPQP